MRIRKSLSLDIATARKLQEMARSETKSMTASIEEMVDVRYQQLTREKKLEAFKRSIGSATGLIGAIC